VDGAWRPATLTVSANYEHGGLFVLNELVHEYGHTVHEAAIRTRPAFYSMGEPLYYEAFADVPAWSMATPAWQRRYLGAVAAGNSAARELYSNVMLDVAWGLFELRLLRAPETDPNVLWSEIAQRYLNVVPHPELSWWALRVQLVETPGYMINYGLGAVLTAELRACIGAAIGPFDAGNARWYGFVSARLLSQGAAVDTPVLLRRLLGRAVTPAALIAQLRRVQRAGTASTPR
jgi:oligoendopeptidase F